MGIEIILIIVVVLFVTFTAVLKRYKRCPSDKIMVIYGKTGKNRSGSISSARCVHGGASFIWPVFQDYAFLDLKPISIECNLTNALSKQNIRVDVPCRFTVGISTEADSMTNAAERLLGLSIDNIQNIATDILFGQLRLVIATMDIEEINADRDKFLAAVSQNVEAELRKIGLKLINVNVTDIRDESGYIEALGKEAAAKAINDAKKSVAEQNRFGEIGKAEADRDKDIRIAETQRDTRIKTAAANALAVQGENTSKIDIANSDAQRREKEAEASRIAVAAEKVQAAKALQEAYQSERDAELARAEREKATQHANIVVPAQIDKERQIIEAEAEAEKLRRTAQGEADAIYAKMEAQARGTFEVLSKQAEGFGRMVNSAEGDAQKAVLMLIADKLPELVKTQVEAVKGIKIDKVTVWDGNSSKDGKSSTAGFISGLMGSVPPLQDLFKMAGLNLPEYLGTPAAENQEHVEDQTTEKK
ncbi:MAG: SPFH domain-containing protein [Bacteroidales bacterium]|uniref:flotillin family protein n=1 Tax=Candidatus Cryptobacteroides sp. TaxID=2952915 RepID=UPI002A6E4647|nr:SPFH domain-containing protein [Candidatus Cryptobacteroides sp.]MBS7277960.1 flotillin family protein [Bacteroidales bacterium]MDD5915802.1 SPFH domain-containing protein [Bacteroidales bacterium]MDD6829270.1 SPFH domain-containing protein [Bacteroidales bacterium]MDD7234558.1 SPFH domain-containing protein [Bacteroidales bacterium]MDY2701991.1 SPFH domain-containing protein [Candidatus Cryptobacteroides sp.]